MRALFNKDEKLTTRRLIDHYVNSEHLSLDQTAKKLEVSKSVVGFWAKRARESNDFEDSKRNGRPKILNIDVADLIQTKISETPSTTSAKLAMEIEEDIGLRVSRWTIQRSLHSLGFKSGLTSPKPALTEKQKYNRMAFAQAHLNTNWNEVIFTDEAKFDCGAHRHRVWYKGRPPHIRTKKHAPKLNARGAFSVKGVSTLSLFEQNMDAILFVNILRTHYVPFAKQYHRRKSFLLMDKDPKHTSKLAKEFMKEEGITWLSDWPAQSPDLNPIENIWGLMKQKLAPMPIQALDELENELDNLWSSMSTEYLITLVESMPRRIQLVIDAHGDSINY